MSAFFPTFEEKLQLAFRGSAKEQKESKKKFDRKRLGLIKQRQGELGLFFGPGAFAARRRFEKKKLGGSNVFKKNLGGTAGS